MDKNELKNRSKYLSKLLRHAPDMLDLTLDTNGWTSIDTLLQRWNQKAPAYVLPFDRTMLEQVVADNDKQRFAISEDGTLIRANQGHSVQIDLGYEAQEPPVLLYHGTAQQNLGSIYETGISKGKRHHVHLSLERDTAQRVGGRHGKPVILSVRAGDMHQAGFLFYCSDNGVWLTDHVPAAYIIRP